MSLDILVVRLPGGKQGPDIVEPLLSNIIVATNRGVTEIQDNEPIDNVSLSTTYRTGVKAGQIVEVMDALQGIVWKGKIVDVSHSYVLADMWTDIEIERPRT